MVNALPSGARTRAERSPSPGLLPAGVPAACTRSLACWRFGRPCLVSVTRGGRA